VHWPSEIKSLVFNIHIQTLDTGLSDFHHLISTELKSTYPKFEKNRKIRYRSYKNFNEKYFVTDLSNSLSKFIDSELNYDTFESVFEYVLDRHVPMKSKFIRGNENHHLNRALRKAILRRSHLRNVYLKSHSVNDSRAYREQRNYVPNLNRKVGKERKKYFESVASNLINVIHHFWKLYKPFMSERSSDWNIIILAPQDNKILYKDLETAEAFNALMMNQRLKFETVVTWSLCKCHLLKSYISNLT